MGEGQRHQERQDREPQTQEADTTALTNKIQMFMSDPGIAFSKSIGWTRGADRTGRFAILIDRGRIVYAENEPGGDVTVCLSESQRPLSMHKLTFEGVWC